MRNITGWALAALALLMLVVAATAWPSQQGTVTVEVPKCTITGEVPTWSAAAQRFQCQAPSGAASPSGAILPFDLPACPSGWSEYTAANDRVLMGTLAADGDAGQTGGSSGYTPAGTISDINVAAHTSHTHNYTDVIAHTHTMPVGATDDTSAPFDRSDAGTNASGANAATATGSTGVATGTTAGPSVSLTHSVVQGTFTGQAATILPPHIKVLYCRKD